MSSELSEACGVFGIWDDAQATEKTYWGTFSLQHRGQESGGVAVLQDGRIVVQKSMGLLQEAVPLAWIADHPGAAALGHVRYSTTGESEPLNAQPLVMRTRFGPMALAHNGNLVNHVVLRRRLEEHGSIFQGTSDSEVLAHLVATSSETSLDAAIVQGLTQLQGGFAFGILTAQALYGARDPWGLRPLVLGQTDRGGYVLASETCALDMVDATWIRDLAPGEVVKASSDGLTSFRFAESSPAACAFEVIYFSRVDSKWQGQSMHQLRRELGRRLAQQAPVAADVVVGVPDSSVPQAMGYAQEAGILFDFGLVKNRYIARTFIEPNAKDRDLGVRLKLSAVTEVVAGKRVVLVDDSLVRGTTSRHIIGLLRRAGAKEVHMRIASPPYREPCHYGIDTSRSNELAARRLSVDQLAREVGADSLAYLSVEGLLDAIGHRGWCLACFGQGYPVPIAQEEAADDES